MTATTATVTQFNGTDAGAAKTALETLNPGTNDKIVFWSIGSRTYVAKLVIA